MDGAVIGNSRESRYETRKSRGRLWFGNIEVEMRCPLGSGCRGSWLEIGVLESPADGCN